MEDYIWPINGTSEPDEMNTSFGPRIDENRWDFHDGIDLPGEEGITPLLAMRDGKVHRAGPGGTDGFSSTHVVLEVDDVDDPDQKIYLVYLHLHGIAAGIIEGETVTQGQLIGILGADHAQYPHLHMEFRKGTPKEIGSVHPLEYLPYSDTSNFTFAPAEKARFNRLDDLMAARLLFDAISRREGDLKRVEVDLKQGTTLLERRKVDFNDKGTINEGNDDEKLFLKNIGVEGYQKSPMKDQNRDDLQYGILVRSIPKDCDRLVARAIDVKGNIATSEPIFVRDQLATDEKVNFGPPFLMPPSGWDEVTSTSGTGTTVAGVSVSIEDSTEVMVMMLSIDNSVTEDEERPQRAGIQYALPAGRFEWTAEGWFNPVALGLDEGQSIQFLRFLNGGNLSVAARILNRDGKLRHGIVAFDGSEDKSSTSSDIEIDPGIWHKWRLHLLRIGTRETTAVLYLDDKETARVNWDSTTVEPLALRAGTARSSPGATAILLTDKLRLTESTLR